MTYTEIINKYVPNIPAIKRENNLMLIPVRVEELLTLIETLYRTYKLPLKTIKAVDEGKSSSTFKIFYIFGIPHEEFFLAPFITLQNTTEFPSLSTRIYETAFYEMEIYNLFGLTPIGHPQLPRFILHENWPDNVFPMRKSFDWQTRPKFINKTAGTFQHVKGEGTYEIPVGPVHAGIIEPGHFRFTALGEEIIMLQPNLGYTHKGTEKLFEVLPLSEKIRLAERVSGDTSFTHSLAFCQAVETLAGVQVPERAEYLRTIFSELERMANHCNDIGFILNDTAFAVGGSHGTRLKEQLMQLCDNLTGHRFMRGVNTIGGVTKDLTTDNLEFLQMTIDAVSKDLAELVSITENNETVINRLKGTGILQKQIAKDHGVVGMAARGSGISTDARNEYPYAAYDKLTVRVAQQTTGDVYARFSIRVAEVLESTRLISQAIKNLPKGAITSTAKVSLKKNTYSLGIAEGWRGDIVYFVSTNDKGEIDRVGIRDASFLNWPAVPYAVAGNIVPDFPLINKSFNLSYSGFDR